MIYSYVASITGVCYNLGSKIVPFIKKPRHIWCRICCNVICYKKKDRIFFLIRHAASTCCHGQLWRFSHLGLWCHNSKTSSITYKSNVSKRHMFLVYGSKISFEFSKDTFVMSQKKFEPIHSKTCILRRVEIRWITITKSNDILTVSDIENVVGKIVLILYPP